MNLVDHLKGLLSNQSVRPLLTIFISFTFNALLAWLTFTGKLPARDYLVSVGPTNAMIIGFWFGEKAALTKPGEGS